MSITIQSTLDPNGEDIEFLRQGISQEAKKKRGMNPIIPFAFFMKDEIGNTIGGLNGFCYYGCLYTDQLYIKEEFRGEGWGTKLVQAAEAFGRKQDCKMFTVTTMDWEARGFYEKLGYQIITVNEGYENNSVMFILRKDMK